MSAKIALVLASGTNFITPLTLSNRVLGVMVTLLRLVLVLPNLLNSSSLTIIVSIEALAGVMSLVLVGIGIGLVAKNVRFVMLSIFLTIS